MKRSVLAGILAVLLLFAGCSAPKNAKRNTAEAFFSALRVYNIDEMKACMTAFPDMKGTVYIDDIFNDDAYVQLYRALFGGISYTVKEETADSLTLTCTFPDIQALYNKATMAALSLAVSDPSVSKKIQESAENGVILVQQIMLKTAEDPAAIEKTTQDFKLIFTEKGGKTLIVCDDTLRALITGNFYLSKNRTAAGD